MWILVNFDLLCSLGHVTWAGTGCCNESSAAREREDNGDIQVRGGTILIKGDMRACSTWPFTRVRAGVGCSTPWCRCVRHSQASGHCGMPAINAASVSAPVAVLLLRIHRSRCALGMSKQRMRGLLQAVTSPGGHTKTTIFSLTGFAVGLQQIGTSVGCRLRDGDGSADWGCGVAVKELFVEVLLDGGDKPLLGGVGAEGWTKRLEEQGWLVHSL